jgi:hypothetical protein
VAVRDKEARFTALLHHVSLERLVMAYWDLSPKASPGGDGVTWQDYGQDLVASLRDLHDRVHSGRYRASPSRRAYIPKADGRLRPLGIAALEDKIVQRAVVGVLNAIYEADFLGFSYGFRPGRNPHQALDALAAGIYRKKVNWVLDADIRDFFGQLDRDFVFDVQVQITCSVCSQVIEEAVRDVADVWDGALARRRASLDPTKRIPVLTSCCGLGRRVAPY